MGANENHDDIDERTGLDTCDSLHVTARSLTGWHVTLEPGWSTTDAGFLGEEISETRNFDGGPITKKTWVRTFIPFSSVIYATQTVAEEGSA